MPTCMSTHIHAARDASRSPRCVPGPTRSEVPLEYPIQKPLKKKKWPVVMENHWPHGYPHRTFDQVKNHWFVIRKNGGKREHLKPFFAAVSAHSNGPPVDAAPPLALLAPQATTPLDDAGGTSGSLAALMLGYASADASVDGGDSDGMADAEDENDPRTPLPPSKLDADEVR